jgi:hypothetical protein
VDKVTVAAQRVSPLPAAPAASSTKLPPLTNVDVHCQLHNNVVAVAKRLEKNELFVNLNVRPIKSTDSGDTFHTEIARRQQFLLFTRARRCR